MPEKKEIHFFGTDLQAPHFLRNEKGYLKLFEKAGNVLRIGEASVWYLYSNNAAKEIKDFSPGAKIIAMLRNPIDMVYSYHSQRLYNGTEDIVDFKEALVAERDRIKGLRLPDKPYPIEGLYYSQIARYSGQLERFLDIFGKENVRVILFDDFKAHTRSVYRETLRFLQIDEDFDVDYRIVNPNRKSRSNAVKKLLQGPPRLVSATARLLLSDVMRHRLRRKVQQINTAYVPRPVINNDAKKILLGCYQDEVTRLGRLIERDLEKLWLHSLTHTQRGSDAGISPWAELD